MPLSQCLHPRKIFSGELKSVVTVMMLIQMPCQAFYGKDKYSMATYRSYWNTVSHTLCALDFETTRIKYTVGFTQLEPGVIISTPFQLWPQNFKDIVPVSLFQGSIKPLQL
jgi:hypothetical protein